jgi:hypothetical protein
LRFTVPAGCGSTYKIEKLAFHGIYAAAGTVTIKLYDTDGTTVLQQATMDTDADASLTAQRHRYIPFDEADLSVLQCGSTYRLSILPDTIALTVYSITVDAAADMDAWPMGQDWHMSTRADSGAWTDDTLSRPAIWPIMSEFSVSPINMATVIPSIGTY